ncbi:hypothetical protein GCM10020218_103610 [Dactylosporangium vinaceum]
MHTVRVTVRPGGDDAVRVAVDGAPERVVALAELGKYQIQIDRSADEDRLSAVGRGLFDALFGAGAATPEDGARLLLDLADAAPQVLALPWELMQAPDDAWLFGGEHRPAARVVADREPPAPLCAPVEMLVVAGDADRTGDLGVAAEIDAIYHAVSGLPACWNVEVLIEPAMDEFIAAMRTERHILHFIGHGEQRPGGRAQLRVESGWSINPAVIASNQLPCPRLVVLNACRTAGETAAVRGVGAAFLTAGVPAVVTTQGDVRAQAGVAFARELYGALAEAVPVDVAVARARARLLWSRPRFRDHEWAVPVLTVATAPEHALRVTRPGDAVALLAAVPEPASDTIRQMVDRCDVRRAVWSWLRDASGLLAIHGEAKAGKSTVAQWTMLTARVHGTPAAAIEADGRLDYAGLLRRMVAAVEAEVGPEAAGPAQRFRAALDGAAPAVGVVRPSDDPLDPGRVAGLFATFAEAAVPAAGIVLVIDPFTPVAGDADVLTRLIVPAAKGELGRVRLVLVDRRFDAALRSRGDVEVQLFHREDVVRLADEFCVRLRGLSRYREKAPTEDQWHSITRRIKQWAGGRAEPDALARVRAYELVDAEGQARRAVLDVEES